MDALWDVCTYVSVTGLIKMQDELDTQNGREVKATWQYTD